MPSFSKLVLGVLGIFAAAVSASDVHDLTPDSFSGFVAHPLSLIEFYAPWCGHCKKLAPEYELAATELKEKDIPLAKVDCEKHKQFCSTYGITGFPTMKVFRGSDVSGVCMGKSASEIVSCMTKQAMPAVSTIDQENIEQFKTSDKVVLIAYIGSDDDKSSTTFNSVAVSLRDDFVFGVAADPSLAEADGVSQPGIVLYKSFDQRKVIFTSAFESQSIVDFIKVHSTPLIGEVGASTYRAYQEANIPLAYIFAETVEEREKLSEELKPVAQKYKDVVNFATIDAKAYGKHGAKLNLNVGQWPAFAIQDIANNLKFPFDQEKQITENAISVFVEDMVSGRLKPSIKSESVPPTQEGPVYVVVADTYKEIVLDEDKDVLIEFYAPWCGHCKALAPTYEELGALYWNKPEFSSKVSVAKVNFDENDVPDKISGFPTIKMYPAGKKDSPILLDGARSLESLVQFIRENGSHGIDGFAEETVTVETGADEAQAVVGDAPESSSTESQEEAKPIEIKEEKPMESKEVANDAVEDGKSDKEPKGEHDEL